MGERSACRFCPGSEAAIARIPGCPEAGNVVRGDASASGLRFLEGSEAKDPASSRDDPASKAAAPQSPVVLLWTSAFTARMPSTVSGITAFVWTGSGEWVPVPYVDPKAAEELFRHKVLRLLRRKELLSQERLELLLSWRQEERKLRPPELS